MINVEEVKKKILDLLNTKGPSLPIHVSRVIELSPVFSSAILSELVSAQKVKMSKLKVGSSPLYLIPGQEEKLEEFANENLKGVEKSTYLRLKEVKIMDDMTQEPAVRVALRSIKDFAVPIRFQDKLVWKYAFVSNDEAKSLLTKVETKSKIDTIEKKIEIKKIETETKEIPLKIVQEKSPEDIFEKPKEEKQKSKKIKNEPDEFLNEIKGYLISKDIELIKIREFSKKEVIAIIRINSDFGKISFLLVAKDKKRIALADLNQAKKEATFEKMPCYILSRGEPASTLKDFLEEHKNLLKIGKI